MNLYIFFREGGFYPMEVQDDLTAIKQAEINEGTLKVENSLTGKIIWQADTPQKSKL